MAFKQGETIIRLSLLPSLGAGRRCVSEARFRFACPVTSGRCCFGLLAPTRPCFHAAAEAGPHLASGRAWGAGRGML